MLAGSLISVERDKNYFRCPLSLQLVLHCLWVTLAFLLSVVFRRFVSTPVVSGPVSAAMSSYAALTTGPVCDGGRAGSKDGAFGPPGSVPGLWHRLGRGMRCILFVFIWIKTNVRFPWLRAACMLDDQLFWACGCGVISSASRSLSLHAGLGP